MCLVESGRYSKQHYDDHTGMCYRSQSPRKTEVLICSVVYRGNVNNKRSWLDAWNVARTYNRMGPCGSVNSAALVAFHYFQVQLTLKFG